MAFSIPDRPRRGVAVVPWLVMLLPVALGCAAATPPGKLDVKFDVLKELNLNAGTLIADGIEITNGPGTLIKADAAQGSQITDNKENSHWVLNGNVHIEYEGSVLDADSATVAFANRIIKSIEVHGTAARFSHPAKTAGQRYEGRAEDIYFDGEKRQVRFTGEPWFSFGSRECTSDKPLLYSLDSTVLSSESDGKPDSGVRCSYGTDKDRRVPTPRAPDRGSAQ
jgi:lipopolysaccharide export system protein LptA